MIIAIPYDPADGKIFETIETAEHMKVYSVEERTVEWGEIVDVKDLLIDELCEYLVQQNVELVITAQLSDAAREVLKYYEINFLEGASGITDDIIDDYIYYYLGGKEAAEAEAAANGTSFTANETDASDDTSDTIDFLGAALMGMMFGSVADDLLGENRYRSAPRRRYSGADRYLPPQYGHILMPPPPPAGGMTSYRRYRNYVDRGPDRHYTAPRRQYDPFGSFWGIAPEEGARRRSAQSSGRRPGQSSARRSGQSSGRSYSGQSRSSGGASRGTSRSSSSAPKSSGSRPSSGRPAGPSKSFGGGSAGPKSGGRPGGGKSLGGSRPGSGRPGGPSRGKR